MINCSHLLIPNRNVYSKIYFCHKIRSPKPHLASMNWFHAHKVYKYSKKNVIYMIDGAIFLCKTRKTQKMGYLNAYSDFEQPKIAPHFWNPPNRKTYASKNGVGPPNMWDRYVILLLSGLDWIETICAFPLFPTF